MTKLIIAPNLDKPDFFYSELLLAHQGLNREESEMLNARIILALANHIGDYKLLTEAIEVAKSELTTVKKQMTT